MVTVDNYEDLVKCDYLEMKFPRKHRKWVWQAWKRKWFILRRKSSQGEARLEYHKTEETCLKKQNKTVINLTDLVRIEEQSRSRKKAICFKLVFKRFFLMLAKNNENDINEWIRLIHKLVFPQRSPIFKRARGSFLVTVIKTESSEREGLVGEYIMSVNQEQLLLYHPSKSNSNPVAQWLLDDIPRFRLQKLNQLYDAEKIFTISHTKNDTMDDAEFQFLTSNGREILETVKMYTQQRSRVLDLSFRTNSLNAAISNYSFGISGDRSRSCSVQSEKHNSAYLLE